MDRGKILQMAFDLGTAVAESEEMNQFREKEASVLQDTEAYALVQKFQEAREHMASHLEMGEEVSEEEQDDLMALEDELAENPIVKELLDAQEKVNNLMNAVYFSINQAINGPGCSDDDCSSCGGGCSCC